VASPTNGRLIEERLENADLNDLAVIKTDAGIFEQYQSVLNTIVRWIPVLIAALLRRGRVGWRPGKARSMRFASQGARF
jgi:hypothetical protein